MTMSGGLETFIGFQPLSAYDNGTIPSPHRMIGSALLPQKKVDSAYRFRRAKRPKKASERMERLEKRRRVGGAAQLGSGILDISMLALKA